MGGKRIKWYLYDVVLVVNYMDRLSPYELSQVLDGKYTSGNIGNKISALRKNSAKVMINGRWSLIDEVFMVNNACKMTIGELADYFNENEDNIRMSLGYRGLKCKKTKRRLWTKRDEDFIKKNASNMTIKVLVDKLDDRYTLTQVRNKLNFLGIEFLKEDGRLSTMEVEEQEGALCACGCGEIAKSGNDFVHGHNARLRVGESHPNWIDVEERMCVCGCGETFECKVNSNQKYIDGHCSRVYSSMSDPEVVAKMRRSRTGIPSDRKGKSFEEQYGKERAFEIKEKMSEPFLGKTIEERYGEEKANEIKQKLSDGLKGRTWEDIYGEEEANKRRIAFSKARKGKTFEEYFGDERAEEIRESMRKPHNITDEQRQVMSDRRATVKIPFKDTSIEVAVQNLLAGLGIDFETHRLLVGLVMTDKDNPRLLNHQADIVILDAKLIIECDGDYWHCHPYGMVKDHMLDKIVNNNGWKIVRLWGSEIREDLDGCKKRILDLIEV